MANISDAFGDITVEKVGKEFLKFINEVQKDAYYLLVDGTDGLIPDGEGDISFGFGAGGRWSYSSNIDGYLKGDWMTGEKEKKAYDKFIKAFIKKKGFIAIDYKDSDSAMDWMGDGVFEMSVSEDGQVQFSDSWNEQGITLEAYAEMNGESTYWALEYLYGDEVADQYNEYAEKVKKEGKEPVEPEVWYYTLYEEEE